MPEIARFLGIVISMYWNDHDPPHVHIFYQGKKGKVDFHGNVTSGKFHPHTVEAVRVWLIKNQVELAENWKRAKENKPLKKIL
mgnify:CR=1 FL=1